MIPLGDATLRPVNLTTNRKFSTGMTTMNASAHLRAVGYDDENRAALVREQIVSFALRPRSERMPSWCFLKSACSIQNAARSLERRR
jgi:hypothetical protein